MLFGKPFNKTLTLKIWRDEKPPEYCLANRYYTRSWGRGGRGILFGNFGITFAKQIVRTSSGEFFFCQTKLSPAEQGFDLNKVLTIKLFV
jgi:hypothetical protein